MKIKELLFEEMKKTNKKLFPPPLPSTGGMKIELLSYRLLRCRSMWLGGDPFHLHVSPHSYCFRISFYRIFRIEKNSLFSPFLLFQCKFEEAPRSRAGWRGRRHKRNFPSILSSSETFSPSSLTWKGSALEDNFTF